MIAGKKVLENWSLQKATEATDHILYVLRETLVERLPYLTEKKGFGLIQEGETEKLFAFVCELS